MHTEFTEHVAYFLTGTPSGSELSLGSGVPLRPALFARYPDLDALRYDFPLILVDSGQAATSGSGVSDVVSLSRWVDDLVDELVEGVEPSEALRLRHHAVRLERATRRTFSAGRGVRLSQLWSAASEQMLQEGDEVLADSLERLVAARDLDGDVVACDGDLPIRLVRHLWQKASDEKARLAKARLDRLALGLADILRADEANSSDGYSAERLSTGFGPAFAPEFDFAAMSRVLGESLVESTIPGPRRERIERLLNTLRGQRFFATDADMAQPAEPYGFEFQTCSSAVDAYRQRLPELVSLAEAVRMAELEVDGAYREDVHDSVFDTLGASDLSPSELAGFPDYLVTASAAELAPDESAALGEALTARLPLKALVQVDDLSDPFLNADNTTAPGEALRQISHNAVGIGGVHVVQAPSSHLYRVMDSIGRGVAHPGPTLMSVFSGVGGQTDELPPYLVAAAAVEARAFPVFTFEPAAGPDWASRFSVAVNPQPERDWPVHEVLYEDEDLQLVMEEVPFTLIDFLACDTRHVDQLADVPRSRWGDQLVTISECVAGDDEGMPSVFPHVVMTDPDGGVRKLLVKRQLIEDARRCLAQWHSLRELGGVRNSFAERLLARERQAWEEQAQLEAEARDAEAATAATGAALVSADGVAAVADDGEAAPAAPARDPDVPMVETPRCSTCDECTKLNDRMFKYNQNKQAYIADLTAGTYADMVTAAERCQVAIIHPGKPWNPDEPDLDELLKRAEPFR